MNATEFNVARHFHAHANYLDSNTTGIFTNNDRFVRHFRIAARREILDMLADDSDRSLRELRAEFRMCEDGDSWGSVMLALFDIAAELYYRGEGPPDDWQYSPGALGGDPREPDSGFYDAAERATTEALETFGETLNRYRDMLRAAGRDY